MPECLIWLECNLSTHSQKEQQDATERLKSIEYEKDYYKAQANDAMQDLDKGKAEHYTQSHFVALVDLLLMQSMQSKASSTAFERHYSERTSIS